MAVRRRVFRVRGNKVSKWNACKNGLRVSVEEAITNLMAKSRVSSQLEVGTVGAVYQTLLLETTGNKNNSQKLKSRASPAPQAKKKKNGSAPCHGQSSSQTQPKPRLRASEPRSPRQATRPHQGSSSSSIFPSTKAPERGQSGAVGGGRWAYKQQRLLCIMVKVLVEKLRRAKKGQTRQIAESIVSFGSTREQDLATL